MKTLAIRIATLALVALLANWILVGWPPGMAFAVGWCAGGLWEYFVEPLP